MKVAMICVPISNQFEHTVVWLGAVDLTQSRDSRLIFGTSQIDEIMTRAKWKPFVADQTSYPSNYCPIVCVNSVVR
jgi:hypothetical protein